MLTVNFRDQVMYALAYKMGLDPVNDLLDDEAKAYASFINSWVRKLYDHVDWPEWTFTEQRTPSGHYVDFAQAGQKAIGRVFKVYLLDPSTVQGVWDVPFRLGSQGIHVGFEHGPTIWIKFIQPAPQFTATVWSADPTYVQGDVVYDPASGNCYASIVPLNHNHLVTDTNYWALVPFPLRLVDLVLRGAYAEALREDGQTDKGNAEETALMTELSLTEAKLLGAIYAPLTEQSQAPARYRPPGATGAQ